MPAMTTRTYRGSLAEATFAYQNDAAIMAEAGWYPTSSRYQPPSWRSGAFIFAFLANKPPGTLVVTYQRRDDENAAPPPHRRSAVADGIKPKEPRSLASPTVMVMPTTIRIVDWPGFSAMIESPAVPVPRVNFAS